MNSRRRIALASLAVCALTVAVSRRTDALRIARPQPAAAQTHTEVLGVSRDGATAVIRLRHQQDRNVLPRYRRVELATGRLVSEWTLPSRDGIESSVFFGRLAPRAVGAALDTPAHRRDLARHFDALSGLRTNNDLRFAVGAQRAVFNVGDDLWMAERDGRNARKVSSPPAAYGPTVAPDGQRVAYTNMVGRLDGVVGNYVLHLLDLRGSPQAIRVTNTRDVWYEDLSWSPDGRYVYARMGAEHPEGGCFVRVLAQPPFHVERLACVDQSERIDFITYSPGGRFAVVRGYTVFPSGGARHSLQWVDTTTGRVTATARFVGVMNLGGVNDQGLLLAQIANNRALALDPATRRARESADSVTVPIVFHDAAWLDDQRYVIGENGTARVINLAQLQWTDRPWPAI